jgi:hypothetical protein
MRMQKIIRDQPEQVFITVLNAEPNATLDPGKVVQWTLGTNATQAAGQAVKLVGSAVNLTSGIGGRVAGVVPVGGTIATGAIGAIQVYGYHGAVRSSASIGSGRGVVASSVNATNIGHVDLASQSTAVGAEYLGALVGWTIEDSANATSAKVFISIM